MNEPGQLIADTLRDIAAGAPAPRPMADAAWQAIIMSGVVFSHPTVQMPITTGQALINAGYTSRGGPEGILHHLGYVPPVSGG